MSSYYRSKFSKLNTLWQRRKQNKKKVSPISSLLKQFYIEEFGEVVNQMSSEEYDSFSKAVMTILYSHRYKKDDSFTHGIDFSIIRDVLYRYTTEAKNRILSSSMFAYLFHHFVANGKL